MPPSPGEVIKSMLSGFFESDTSTPILSSHGIIDWSKLRATPSFLSSLSGDLNAEGRFGFRFRGLEIGSLRVEFAPLSLLLAAAGANFESMGGIKIVLDEVLLDVVPTGQGLTPTEVQESYSAAVVNLWTTLQAELATWDVQDSAALAPDGFASKTIKSLVSRVLKQATMEIRRLRMNLADCFLLAADNLRLSDGDPDPLEGVEITDYKVGFVQGSDVARKALIMEGFTVSTTKGDDGEPSVLVLAPIDVELALALHLSPDRDSNRLDASASFRILKSTPRLMF
jgi:hypothetical protein